MSRVVAQLQIHCAELAQKGRVFIGYSGGLDSHVLLHAAVAILGAERVIALHINHQLSEQASTWAQHCGDVCRELGLSLQVHTVDICRQASSTENTAREARYGVFAQVLGEGDTLLLAHHQDDQAETVLYRLLRNAGPRGLAGIPFTRVVGKGSLLRPLLQLPRRELDTYARAQGLDWIEDPSNTDLIHDRNYLRHRVTAELRRRWPDFSARIAASARLCQQADELNNDLAEIDLDNLSLARERLGWSVNVSRLATLSRARQANVLRYWAGLQSHSPPGYRSVSAVLDTVLPAGQDRAPLVVWPGGEWRRFDGKLFLLPSGWRERVPLPSAWDPGSRLALADGSALSAMPTKGLGLQLLPGERLLVKFRRGGERCRPAGRSCSLNQDA